MDLNDILTKAGNQIVVGRAFGAPIEKDGRTIIPVAFVAGGGGGGQGTDEKANQGEGGGFGGVVYPIGAYVIRDDQVRFVPAVNVTRLITAVLFVVRAVVKSRMKVTVMEEYGRDRQGKAGRCGRKGRNQRTAHAH